MIKEELYNIGACDYDLVYMSEVRIGLFDSYSIFVMYSSYYIVIN